MYDEEGEEDVDQLFHIGEEVIDVLAESLTMDSISSILFKSVGILINQPQWQSKHAALTIIKQTVEYVEEPDHMKEMAKVLLQHVNHEHPRVRYNALYAIGQLANDQAPQFQEMFHAEVMPRLLQCTDDKVDRVSAMAMSAFVSFSEKLKDVLRDYADQFMQKFITRLTNSNHRGIQEESITAIAVVAGVIDKGFGQYYDGVMPLLLKIISMPREENDKMDRMRGKAFECLSLLGAGVDPQKFLPDAKAGMDKMLAISLSDDDDGLLLSYINQGIQRICHIMKKDFCIFLPEIMPFLLKSMDLEKESCWTRGTADEDDYESITLEGGKVVKVNDSKTQELHASCSMLATFMTETGEKYFDFVLPTAEKLLPVMKTTSQEGLAVLGDYQSQAFWTWSCLIKVAQDAKKLGSSNAQNIIQQLLGEVVCAAMATLAEQKKLDEDFGHEVCVGACSGISESLKSAGPGYMSIAQAGEIMNQIFEMMDQSFKRYAKAKIQQKDHEGDEDEKEWNEWYLEPELSMQRTYEEVMGGLIKACPDAFIVPEMVQLLGGKMKLWMGEKDLKTLVLHLACDLLEHLKDTSCPYWPVFMSGLFDEINDKDVDVRIAASYAVNLAAHIPAFAEAAPEAYKRIAQVISGRKPKRRDEKAMAAMDNAVSAMMSLAVKMRPQCPPEITDPFAMVLSKLPLSVDFEEAKKVHTKVVDLLESQDPGLLGSNMSNLGKVLSLLAEIHKSEEHSNAELDKRIAQIFKTLSTDMLRQNASNFTEKQQKRIEQIIMS
jgi:hypothetical protein